jgi:hypothetical protein
MSDHLEELTLNLAVAKKESLLLRKQVILKLVIDRLVIQGAK